MSEPSPLVSTHQIRENCCSVWATFRWSMSLWGADLPFHTQVRQHVLFLLMFFIQKLQIQTCKSCFLELALEYVRVLTTEAYSWTRSHIPVPSMAGDERSYLGLSLLLEVLWNRDSNSAFHLSSGTVLRKLSLAPLPLKTSETGMTEVDSGSTVPRAEGAQSSWMENDANHTSWRGK